MYRAGADSLGFATAGSEAARIDSSGRLGVGTSSPQSIVDISQANGGDVYITNPSNYGTSPGISPTNRVSNGISWRGNIATGFGSTASIGETNFIRSVLENTSVANSSLQGRYALTFGTARGGASVASANERMRITSDGLLRIGFTTEAVGAHDGVQLGTTDKRIFSRTATGTVNQIRFANGNGYVGSITTNLNSTAFNTSSDYRLKENIIPLTDAISRLSQLSVCRFNFKNSPEVTLDGFLAHEAQAVVPECVTGTKDEVDDEGNPVYQAIDQSKLVPLLTAALQEALAKIEVLEQRLTDAGIA